MDQNNLIFETLKLLIKNRKAIAKRFFVTTLYKAKKRVTIQFERFCICRMGIIDFLSKLYRPFGYPVLAGGILLHEIRVPRSHFGGIFDLT